ncbi:MAG: hypothetical protein V7742_11695 [Halioglobus sp.]
MGSNTKERSGAMDFSRAGPRVIYAAASGPRRMAEIHTTQSNGAYGPRSYLSLLQHFT